MPGTFDKRSVGYGGAVFHGEILRGHACPENILAERMDQRGCALICVKGNRHRHVRRIVQVGVAERGPLRFSHVLRVLVVWPARELYVQERQILASEYGTVLVDQRGHLRLILRGGRKIHRIVASLVPEHTCHMKIFQRCNMVRVDISAAHMSAYRRAAPRGLDDADRHVRMLRAQLKCELLCQVAQMQ